MSTHATQLETPVDSSAAGKPLHSARNLLALCVRVLALGLLFSLAACIECKYQTALADSDIWIYLRTGAWILHNHALPHSSLFTQYTGRPWVAYSWGFDIVAAAAYHVMGLRAVPLMLAVFKAILALAAFFLAGGRRNFWLAVCLCAVAQYTMPELEARPGFLSILLLAVELILLFRSRRSGSLRPLLWLPPLFILWANMHIQFLNGLLVLGLFFAATLVEQLAQKFHWQWPAQQAQSLLLTKLATITGACLAATLLSPYTYHVYQVAWQYAHSAAAYSYIPEMHAMNFREPQHYVRLLLAIAAFFALGRKRPLDLFQLALLLAGIVIGFHARRDAWMLVLPATAIIANAFYPEPYKAPAAGTQSMQWRWQIPLAVGFAVVVLALAVRRYIPPSQDALLATVAANYPVRACNAIRDGHLPQPLFNPLTWGGFVMWYLPEYPVSSDGRVDLYGDDIVIRQYEVLDSQRSPLEEPTFASAHTLLLKTYSPLAWTVSRSPRYKLVYRDDMAAVFVRTQ